MRQAAARHYGSHPYFTRRPWNVVQAYIENFSDPGDVVLDPFGGSGVTAVESLVLRRRTIHVDINPLANFITRQIAVSPVRLHELSHEYHKLLDDCRAQVDEWKAKPEEFFENEAVPYWYPAGVRLPTNADVQYVEELFTRRQLFALSLLFDRIMHVRNQTVRDLLRFCFSATLSKTNRTFISARNRAATRGGSSIFSIYRYNVPQRPVELDAWEQFQDRFGNLMQCKKETNDLIGDFYSDSNCRILHGSADRLGELVPSESIDYVFTDPPYGGHIAYIDLSAMWNAWLGLPVRKEDRESEMIEGGDMRHTRDHYLALLDSSIAEISRVLKAGACASIVFQHSDGSLHAAILEAAEKHGLSYTNTVAQSLDVIWSMHKKKNSMRVLSGELVLNFCKSRKSRKKRSSGRASNLREVVRSSALACCSGKKGAATEDVFNDVMVQLIDAGSLGSTAVTLDDVLRLLPEEGFHFDSAAKKWYSDAPVETAPGTLF